MKRLFAIFGITLCLLSCGDDDSQSVTEILPPEEVTLIFPFENSECNEGTNITDTESTVLFEWQASENTDEYELVLINLNNEEEGTVITTADKIPVVVRRGTPYAWYVISRSQVSDSVAQSATWKFYNAGDGIESYAPFPADNVFPGMSATIDGSSGQISLDWEGGDVDNDIVGYDVYFGTANPPELFESDVLNSELANIAITSGTIYYWSVHTKDAANHQSESRVFQFKVE